MAKNKARAWFPWISLALIATLIVACASEPIVDKKLAFLVVQPESGDAVDERQFVAEVQAVRRTEIRSRIKGRIETVAIDEGHPASAGQVLFSLDETELRQELRRAHAAVASASADLKAARTERESTQVLHEKGIVSPTEVALLDAKIGALDAKLEEAKAEEGRATINLGYAQVRAPFAGVVNRLARKAGSLVDEGELLTTLSDTREVLAYFRVPESEYFGYTETDGDKRPAEVSFVLADGQSLGALGVIDTVETEVDRGTGTIAFRARFPNPDGRLKHGSTGKVVVRSHLQNALRVPQRATFEVQDHLYVYVVDSDNVARARRIVPKLRSQDSFVLQSGLASDERFIAEGVQKVRDGDRIEVRVIDATVTPVS